MRGSRHSSRRIQPSFAIEREDAAPVALRRANRAVVAHRKRQWCWSLHKGINVDLARREVDGTDRPDLPCV
jgi:hypothetical protein